ncbi:DUF302 domain-containing protein [Acidithiobacillus sp. AMEEHan]|uniref:DUF302 domain-containing protein n=1 Tax=Acidithiobacillus sp. AMEEHan TaxID=2994951 RepID=UPI0027E58826|nr:DUF302 domain-containing protein [Acidithiobacillus sp. AMEEHan]
MKRITAAVLGFFTVFTVTQACAAPLYVEKVDLPIASTMSEITNSLHAAGYKIVLKLNILKLIEGQQKTLKIPDFDAVHFTDARAIVFCNPYDFSKLLNTYWPSAAACPLNLTVFGRGQDSYIVYGERIAYAGTSSANKKVTKAVDSGVIKALQQIPMSRELHKIPDWVAPAA